MSAHCISLRMVLKVLIVGMIGLLITATAHGKSPLPPLTGDWTGVYKVKGEHGPDAEGTVSLTITQNGTTGTMLGLGISDDSQVNITISGDYTINRRKLTGLFDLSGDVIDTGTFKGKSNGSGNRLNIKLNPATGGKVRIQIDRVLTP